MRKSRRKAREFALKALYEWKLAGNTTTDIAQHMRDEEGYASVATSSHDLSNPFRLHWPSVWTRLSTDNHPINSVEIH